MSTAYTPLALAVLQSKTLRELAELHNEILHKLPPWDDGKPVNRFADKTKAIARVQALEARLEEQTRKAPGAARTGNEPAKQRKRRGPYFVFKPEEQQRVPKANSRRFKAFELLRRPEGATQKEIEEVGGWQPRQAYEAIRLMHYMHGYGLRFVDADHTRVQAYTKAEAAS